MTIREARKQLSLSQVQTAKLLGIPVRTYEGWETGNRKPPEYVERMVIEKLEQIKKEQG